MNPPIFEIVKADPTLTALLGSNPCRFYPWSDAPQNAKRPYVTYGVFNGVPENYLSSPADIDNQGTQVDIWSTSPGDCEAIFTALRNALSTAGYLVSYTGAERDTETQLYHARQEWNFWTQV